MLPTKMTSTTTTMSTMSTNCAFCDAKYTNENKPVTRGTVSLCTMCLDALHPDEIAEEEEHEDECTCNACEDDYTNAGEREEEYALWVWEEQKRVATASLKEHEEKAAALRAELKALEENV